MGSTVSSLGGVRYIIAGGGGGGGGGEPTVISCRRYCWGVLHQFGGAASWKKSTQMALYTEVVGCRGQWQV